MEVARIFGYARHKVEQGRARRVVEWKVKKAGRKHKEALVETIHECLDKYTHVYALSLENMRTSLLKDLRQKLTEDRFVMGKQNVMALALGRSPEESAGNERESPSSDSGDSIFPPLTMNFIL
eukprot:763194-Hanusia_phi.AAC.4